MNKQVIAGAIIAFVSAGATAQVTIYGTIDTSLVGLNRFNPAGQSNKLVASSVWLPSVFGFRGAEDLGGGLQANFNLESDLNTDTGTYAGGTNSLFRRAATVGLSGGFGSVKFGRQLDHLFLQSFLNNVRLSHSGSAAVVGGLAYGLANANASSDANIFRSNVLQYQSPSIMGLTVTGQYSLGETAGESRANSAGTIGINYAGIPGLDLNAVYQQSRNATGVTVSRNYLVGGKYSFGAATLATSFTHYENPSIVGTPVDANAIEIGGAYAITPATTAALNYVRFDDDVADVNPHVVSVSLKYNFSKRTSVWGMVVQTDGKGRVPLSNLYGATVSGASFAGKSTGTAIGVTHQF